jgi:hypothetical protein
MTTTPALRRSSIRVALRYAGPFTVTSRADGTLLITPTWSEERRPPGCKGEYARNADGDCTRCGAPHIPGFLTRMFTARVVETLLNRERKIRRR